jgi:hypothetical protein
MTIRQFVALHKITIHCHGPIASNPYMERDEWSRSATHWLVTLRCDRRRLCTYFSQGPAFTSDPSATDVLECLQSDAIGIVNATSFETWAADLGLDTDSRSAERTFHACARTTARLRRFLGDAFDAFLAAEAS